MGSRRVTKEDLYMTKNELLAQTLYYKGEEDYPEALYVINGKSSLYWDYERVWVRWELEQDDEYLRLMDWFKREILQDQAPYPSVPLGLQAIFASRISHWASRGDVVSMDSVRRFCDEYVQVYADIQKHFGN